MLRIWGDDQTLAKKLVTPRLAGDGSQIIDPTKSGVRTSFGNPDVHGRAIDIAESVKNLMPDARVTVAAGGSAAGKSSYISIQYKPEGAKRMVQHEFRVSDHGIGDRRYHDYAVHANVAETTDLSDVMEKLAAAKGRVDDSIDPVKIERDRRRARRLAGL